MEGRVTVHQLWSRQTKYIEKSWSGLLAFVALRLKDDTKVVGILVMAFLNMLGN